MIKLHGILRRINGLINRVCIYFTGVLLSGLIVSNLVSMISLSGFSQSVDWTYEVNLLISAWLYFIGVCQVYFRNGDISVDLLTKHLPDYGKHVWSVLSDIITAVTFCVIAWFGVKLIELQLPFKTPGLSLPNALFTAPIVIGPVIMILQVVERMTGKLNPVCSPISSAKNGELT